MSTYFDNDGLLRKYGPRKAVPNTAGEYKTYGALREIEVRLDLTALTEAETIVSDQTFVPAGVRIEEVELVTVTAAATGTAIDVGLIRLDRATEIDYNGLVNAEVAADMSADGEKSIFRQEATVGASGGGALIGTTTANPGYITASRTTSTAFTAGEVILRIRYMNP